MVNHRTVARPYAKAIFDQAVLDRHLEQWSIVLRGLALITIDSTMAVLYGDPKITSNVIETLIYDTLKEGVPEAVAMLNDKLKNTLSLLLEEKRLLMANDINILYHHLMAGYNSMIEIDVFSAMPLSEEQQAAFYQSLEKRFASKVSIAFQEDSSLIGGALIRSGNWVLDGSIDGKITRLNDTLLN